MNTRPAPSRSRAQLLGISLVVISACGFGSGALFAKPVYAADVDWMTLLWWRFLLAGSLSWGWLLLRGGDRRAFRALPRRRVLVLLALGILYTGNSGTYYASLQWVPASLAALIVYIYPAVVAVLSLRYGRRLEGRRAWLALGISTLGVALALGGIAPGAVPPIGALLLAIASPLIYAVWIVLAARLGGERASTASPPADAEATSDGTDPAPAVALLMTGTAATYLLLMLLSGRPITPTAMPSQAWPGIIGIAVLSTALAVQAFYAGARRIGAARASLVSTVEPVYTIVLATILFGENLTAVQLLGGLLVIGGVLLAETAPTTQPAGTTPEARQLVRQPTGPDNP
jgi:drug/metabolite transporter (DMT)-like permease